MIIRFLGENVKRYLEEAAMDWNKAQIIRNFITVVENNIIRVGGNQLLSLGDYQTPK
jgi:hypothetical protein